jgi:hypothetical protein
MTRPKGADWLLQRGKDTAGSCAQHTMELVDVCGRCEVASPLSTAELLVRALEHR